MKLQLSREEVSTYHAAADRVHEPCEMTLDLTQPVMVENVRRTAEKKMVLLRHEELKSGANAGECTR